MRDFELLEPGSAIEASRMMADHGEDARLYAGGTALLLAMRQRLLAPSHVVYVGALPGLNAIEFDETSGLRIGALARHADLANAEVVRKRYPMLASMAGQVANPQVRNVATLGGNLCYADPATDPPTCLMALGARVRTVSSAGERTLGLENFYVDYYQTALTPDEVVVGVDVPPLQVDMRGAYTRFLRTAAEHRPLVGVAVIGTQTRGALHDCRIAIGASVPIPTRSTRAEQFLEGKPPSRQVIEDAAALAAEDIQPLSDFRGSAEYRREMVRVVVKRTAAEAFRIVLD
jgi:carbon-monoxide dehydrogenase medium subunit